MCGEWVEGGILIDVTSTYEKSVSVFEERVACTCDIYNLGYT